MYSRWTMIVLAVGVSMMSLAAAPQVAAPRPTTDQTSQLMKDMLGGKWDITLTPDDEARQAGEKEVKDTLVFKRGTFVSTTFQKRGFEPSSYEEGNLKGSIGGFDCVQTSKTDQGKAKWSGSVAATQIQGDLVWTKKDGTVLNFSYRGSKE
jgi:hypothetical protein